MGRYKDTKVKKLKNGTLVKNTTIYHKIPERDDDLLVMSTEGDRFDLLANQYYGDPSLWWYIAKANNMKFNNIPAGLKLRIPSSISFATGN
tara:strand:- start:2465 stop:2737 length:273 start_codon:yes stop_codon:yes gene_type:complete